jgi:hypothetical protein
VVAQCSLRLMAAAGQAQLVLLCQVHSWWGVLSSNGKGPCLLHPETRVDISRQNAFLESQHKDMRHLSSPPSLY